MPLAMPADEVAALDKVATQQQWDCGILLDCAKAHFNPDWVGTDGRYGLTQLTFEQVQADAAK